MLSPETICKKAIPIVKEVGNYIRLARKSGFEVEEKSLKSLVTHIDKTSETKLVSQLKKLLPEAGILGEEGIANETSDKYNWIIDPLDGTTNFIHGMPCYSVSVALMDKKEVIVGIVYEINQDECFYAWKDGGAFLNEEKIYCTDNSDLKHALIATGFPYNDFSQMESYLALFSDLMKSTRGLRRLGSAAVDLAYVACGRFDAFYEIGLNAWDVAAGVLIVEEAGGNLSDFSGGDNYIFGQELISAGPAIFNPFLETVKKYF